MKKLLSSVSVLALMVSVFASADAFARRGGPGGGIGRGGTQRLVIRMYDQQFRGQNTIGLKRELRAQYPNLNLRRMKLDSVRFVAKSKRGRGQVSLTVDGYEVDRSSVYGTPNEFHDNARYTYDRIDLSNYGRSQGPWQLQLRGNIKVKRIVVMVSGRHGGGGPGRPGRSFNVQCESSNHNYNSCYAGRNLIDISVATQLSRSSCIKNSTYGITGDSVWVSGGCRAIFRVTSR